MGISDFPSQSITLEVSLLLTRINRKFEIDIKYKPQRSRKVK